MPRYRIQAWCGDERYQGVIEAPSLWDAQGYAVDICLDVILVSAGNYTEGVESGSSAIEVPADTELTGVQSEVPKPRN
jgi:hypothetical protein